MARIKLKYVNAFANRGRKDKRVRYYFRRRGGKAMPLPGLPGSEEFMAAYAAALAGLPHVEIGASRTLPGTINALVVNYYRSDDWQKLAADTKKNRRRVIERFRAKHGNKRVALLQREHILGMLAAIERPSAKRHWLKAIRGLLRAAVPTMRRDDPTEGIAGIKMPKTKGHHTWTDEEIAQYRAYWPLGTQQRLVMNSRSRPRRGVARSSGSARSTSGMGASASSAPTAAKMLICRRRRSYRQRAMRLRLCCKQCKTSFLRKRRSALTSLLVERERRIAV
jgi:hypothetical protein